MAQLDRKAKRARWTKARAAQAKYNSQLRAVARQVGSVVKGLAPDGKVTNLPVLVKALKDYAQLLDPWARSVAKAMVADVARRDSKMWATISKDMGVRMRQVLKSSPASLGFRALQDDQVKLIKSLPLQAAQRVHDLTQEALVDSRRAAEIAKEIAATGLVTESRARLIARTETARAGSNLVQARSQWAGSQGYIWRTSLDMNVRDSHEAMEGVYVRWSEPPVLDNLKGHAGTLPNCRCYAEPVFPDDD
jgi:SPP1 gp7 family putative phage head morphogenesis protein